MNTISNWTREYFISNQESCIQKLNDLSLEERACLKSNLKFKECGQLVLVDCFMVSDICENEFYCEKYQVKNDNDGSIRIENGKYADKLNIGDDETCENPTEHLAERQVFIISKSDSNNLWTKEVDNHFMNSNKRKIDEDSEQKSFLVKLYDNTEVILNELVEIIGFIYPTPQYSSGSIENEDFNEDLTQLPPYNIHVVSLKKRRHNNSLLFKPISESDSQITEDIQRELLNLLKQILFGDELCATFLLCHLISHVYSRVNDDALGKFTLNLICRSVPAEILKEYAIKLYNVIFETLLPNSIYIPMTIENLNSTQFVPKKDYTTNRLSAGLLQLPSGTNILLDETKLANGKLDHSGCTAISQFSELIKTQQLSYDFQFYKIPYKTDNPVLIISEGKSLLASDFSIPIKPNDEDCIRLINENFAAVMHYMRPKLNAFRCYLTSCRLQSFDIGDEETKMIEADFVKMRENSNFQVEDLHKLLVISRLIGISKGLKFLDKSSWEIAKHMESERKDRLEKRNVNEP
ncbi:hypothetical protein PVAND_011612 [Polypedilum vanderplanki]|uniref:Mini-chromosome maintenance complex-binding protein n=1 Tax=Polypedilum vanderplanki TaxID=319348 RepID=A0A9J6CK03_POLVA|nr:hypothetical protein PVAND_011612 [Polypedilum vanderplanki]